MKPHTWYDLADSFCARSDSLISGGKNKNFERFAARRYNYAHNPPAGAVRLVFLRDVALDKNNKTLSRDGRFVWCKELKYEGKNSDGYRTISFNIRNGNKRFHVSEQHVLAIPHNVYVNNNSFFRKYNRIFTAFASVFDYRDAVKVMRRNDDNRWKDLDDFVDYLRCETPFRPGTLVNARNGMFFPRLDKLQETMGVLTEEFCESRGFLGQRDRLNEYVAGRNPAHLGSDDDLRKVFQEFHEWCKDEPAATHPVGVILGRSRNVSPHSGRELYRVSFAETIYEEVNPVQLEVINEV
jgi:hypothetical protein